MKKELFDYELGSNVEHEVDQPEETLKYKIHKSIKSRSKTLLVLVLAAGLIFSIDAGIHRASYNWYDWTDSLSSEGTSLAATVAARYQLSSALLEYPNTKELKKFYSAERRCAREELRDLGYRGSIPSKDWPELN